MPPRRSLPCLASLCLAFAAGHVLAQDTYYWNPNASEASQGGSGVIDATTPLWNESNTPSDTLAPWSDGNHAVFGGTGGTITSNNTSLTTRYVTFRSAAYTLAGDLNLNIVSGSLVVEQSGSLTVTDALAINADLALYHGTLNVNGGSFSTSTNGYIGVNSSSNGRLNISNGGSAGFVNNSVGTLGSSYGFITVDGTGSTLTTSSNHYIGQSGQGELTISNGATATDYNAHLGHESTGIGYVTVDGAGSTWTVANLLSFKGGTVAVTNGGHVALSASSFYLAGANATLSIGRDDSAAGTVQASWVDGTAGRLRFDHNETNLTFSTPILGGIAVEHVGSGTTTLNSANWYFQGTTLTNGTLRLGINQALGHSSGDLTLAGGALDLNGFSQTSDILILTADSLLDFSGSSSLTLNDSSGLEWSGSLEVLNFGAGDIFRIGSDAFGLTAEQLMMIHIDGFYAQIDAEGYISASANAIAIPEPSTYAAMAGLLALGLAWRQRRQCAR